MIIVIILWLFLSFVVASYGSKRKIGYTSALLLSLILSPLIGGIIVALSDNETDELNKIKISYDAGLIDKDEYQKQVRAIIPDKEDKEEETNNQLMGCLITIIIFIIGYAINSFLN